MLGRGADYVWKEVKPSLHSDQRICSWLFPLVRVLKPQPLDNGTPRVSYSTCWPTLQQGSINIDFCRAPYRLIIFSNFRTKIRSRFRDCSKRTLSRPDQMKRAGVFTKFRKHLNLAGVERIEGFEASAHQRTMLRAGFGFSWISHERLKIRPQ